MSMPGKRKTGRGGAKRIGPKPLFVLLVTLGVTVTSSLVLYICHSKTKPVIPAYEETRRPTSNLARDIKDIDAIIYEVLYEGGVPERDISFLAVRPRHRSGMEWDFTDLLVRLSEPGQIHPITSSFAQSLKGLGSLVSYKLERTSRDEALFHLSSGGYYTHRIRLTSRGYARPERWPMPRAALIVDDLGYDRDILRTLSRINFPMDLSLLPMSPYREEVIGLARAKGSELILHLPMEPNNYPEVNPGPGTILASMGDREIRNLVGEHIGSMPGVKGVNNHMGSYFTTRPDKMTVVMGELKKRGLFFVDSRTTTQTVAFEIARKVGVSAANRAVFLDNDLHPKALAFQMKRLIGIARQKGSAIGICHPHKKSFDFLRSYTDRLKGSVKLVRVSELTN